MTENVISKSKESTENYCRICRICADVSNYDNPLITPCICKGTIKWVHKNCLKTSIEISRNLNCPICKSNYKNIKIQIKLPGKLQYTKHNLIDVLFYLGMCFFFFLNFFILLHRNFDFYLKRFAELDMKINELKLIERKRINPISNNYLDLMIDSRLNLLNDKQEINNNFNKLIQKFINSLNRLVQISLIIMLKLMKLILKLNEPKIILIINFTLLTFFYMINDMMQLTTIFIIVSYLYRQLNDKYVIWRARNSQLIVGFNN